MESLRHLYRIGTGPSASHTIGPRRAAEQFLAQHPAAPAFRVTLYGSLAATGKGHGTDRAIAAVFSPHPLRILWAPETVRPEHPNGMLFEALDADETVLAHWLTFSTGGGALWGESAGADVYAVDSMEAVLAWAQHTGRELWELVWQSEEADLPPYLEEVWRVMQDAVRRGLRTEGVLPGGLELRRRAPHFLAQMHAGTLSHASAVFAYALAVSEENAAGGLVVTAPTCGSCGVLPAVLYHLSESGLAGTDDVLHALATAGLVGALVKRNASISGAEVGCQGEVGVACAMAAGAAAQLLGGTPRQVEYAAEMGLEHHLGLTCDPVNGLVQIPCIERNVFASSRALSCTRYACSTDGSHRISFDEVVKVMKQTGHDLPSLYRETAGGGLAVNYRFPPQRKPGK